MRYINFLGNKEYPVPERLNKKSNSINLPTTVLIILEMLGEYSEFSVGFYDNVNEILWIEGYNLNNECKAIILANNNYLLNANFTKNYEITSINNPIFVSNLDIEEYLDSIRNIDEYEFYYPEETLSLIGTVFLPLPTTYGKNRWSNSTLVYDTTGYLYLLDTSNNKHYIIPYSGNKLYKVKADIGSDNKISVNSVLQELTSTEIELLDHLIQFVKLDLNEDILVENIKFSLLISGMEINTVV